MTDQDAKVHGPSGVVNGRAPAEPGERKEGDQLAGEVFTVFLYFFLMYLLFFF